MSSISPLVRCHAMPHRGLQIAPGPDAVDFLFCKKFYLKEIVIYIMTHKNQQCLCSFFQEERKKRPAYAGQEGVNTEKFNAGEL